MTSNVSKKTSYLVVGEEAGQSKLTKVRTTDSVIQYMW